MSRIAFRNWLTQEDNLLFWQQPLPSEKMDDLIIDRTIQKSIASSNKNQALYSYIENYIVTSYASLIDYKLREIYQDFSLSDFKEPSGFERREKASDVQLRYFELREQLEFFLKNDIQQHRSEPDAELNSFRRWIEIANILLKRHCYEGFILVFVNLQLMARADITNALPQCVRENYNQLCAINKTDRNHSALRRYMSSHQDETDFSPLIFNYHAIAMLNESIETLKEHELLLREQNKQLIREIFKIKKSVKNPDRMAIKIDALQEQRTDIAKELKKVALILEGQFQQRQALLDRVEEEQKQPLNPLPSHIDKTFQQIKIRFNKQQNNTEKALDSNLSRGVNTTPSTLYSHRLLPSLWKRKGVCENKYWEQVFTPNCLKNK